MPPSRRRVLASAATLSGTLLYEVPLEVSEGSVALAVGNDTYVTWPVTLPAATPAE